MRNFLIQTLSNYLNKFANKNFSENFLQLWSKTSWGFEEFTVCSTEYKHGLESRATKHIIIMIIALVVSIFLFVYDSALWSVIGLLVAFRSYHKSSQYLQAIEQITINSMLARLINEKKVS